MIRDDSQRINNPQERDNSQEKDLLTPETTHDRINYYFDKAQKTGDVMSNHNKNNAPCKDSREAENNQVCMLSARHYEEKAKHEKLTEDIIAMDDSQDPDKSNPDNDYRLLEADNVTLTNQKN
jgi:hypothetical protein